MRWPWKRKRLVTEDRVPEAKPEDHAVRIARGDYEIRDLGCKVLTKGPWSHEVSYQIVETATGIVLDSGTTSFLYSGEVLPEFVKAQSLTGFLDAWLRINV